MIVAIMYSALGFLAATLLALLILPAIWRRAVRLTTRRIEGAIPVSMAEIQADKDQLRAEFAVAARRLERDSDLLRERTVGQFEQISRQSGELIALRGEIEAATARLADFEAANGELANANHRHVETLSERDSALATLTAERDSLRDSLDAAQRQLGEAADLSDSLRVEHVALNTTTDSLRDEIADLKRELAATQSRLTDDRGALKQAVESLASERNRAEDLSRRMDEREAELSASRTEATALAASVAALQMRTAELSGGFETSESALGDARSEIARISSEAENARRHAESVAQQLSDSIEMMRAEKKMLEDALIHVREDRSRLANALELNALDARNAETHAAEGAILAEARPSPTALEVEDAVLRERIGDIAAEVVRLTATLEGEGSPIEAILAKGAQNGGAAGGTTLADRIRAIQNRVR